MDRLLSILNDIGVPYAYDHFAEGEAPDPPFLCYLLPGSDNFSADGKVYRKFTEVRLELYTDFKDSEAEQNVEDVLDAAGIFITSRKPGLTARSCMKFCMLLKCRQTEIVLGKPGMK